MTQGPAAPASGTEPIPAFADLAADPEIAPLLDFEPVVRKVKRPDGWTAELQRELIARIAAAGTLQQAVWQMGKHATGAQALYNTPDADGFRASWNSALELGRRRNGLGSQPPRLGDVPGITRRRPKSPADGPLPGQILNEHGEYEDEASIDARAADAVDSIGGKLLRSRRLFLKEISSCPGKRAAFEILTELPVDWDKAAALEPQEFEPWWKTNQRQPDLVLTAESGWSFGEHGYGPDVYNQDLAKTLFGLSLFNYSLKRMDAVRKYTDEAIDVMSRVRNEYESNPQLKSDMVRVLELGALTRAAADEKEDAAAFCEACEQLLGELKDADFDEEFINRKSRSIEGLRDALADPEWEEPSALSLDKLQ